MDYQPIENYGIIGDLNTVALVGMNGSIDFMCLPDFDSPSIFAALLDKDKGGNFQIHPLANDIKYKQIYYPDTNILLTSFLCNDGVGEITDFMPVQELYTGKEIVRRVTTLRGKLAYRMNCSPRFNYARSVHTHEIIHTKEVTFNSEGLILRLRSSVPLQIKNGDAYAEFTLNAGQCADFILEKIDDKTHPYLDITDFINHSLNDTITYWRKWIAQSKYTGKWMEHVNRSALVLKLLTSHTHGSIVAAPTFSLPEKIGGDKNWDYRYTWIRDASFTVYVLMELGFYKEANGFIRWVENECKDVGHAGDLKLMYTLDGRHEIEEMILDHLEGYKNSRPVRIGNNAFKQFQLDIYGELLDAIYLYDKHGNFISMGLWKSITEQMDWLCKHWTDEDHGIWEMREKKKDHLYSKLLCWVALDKSIKIGEAHSFPLPEKWKKERDIIHAHIYKEYWNEQVQSFVQLKKSEKVDASLLLLQLVDFIGPTDQKWLSTLNYIEKNLVTDGLIYRYEQEAHQENPGQEEGTFSMCSFWYIECLSRSGQLQKALVYFEKIMSHANHLGLFSEQLGLQGEHLGNFPQAFTHIGLISTVFELNKKLNAERHKLL